VERTSISKLLISFVQLESLSSRLGRIIDVNTKFNSINIIKVFKQDVSYFVS
jgi:hypothetical protein